MPAFAISGCIRSRASFQLVEHLRDAYFDAIDRAKAHGGKLDGLKRYDDRA